MKPGEFWALHPREFHWIADATRPRKRYGSMTEDEVAALYDDAYGDDAD